jgi:hypothetical protein
VLPFSSKRAAFDILLAPFGVIWRRFSVVWARLGIGFSPQKSNKKPHIYKKTHIPSIFHA